MQVWPATRVLSATHSKPPASPNLAPKLSPDDLALTRNNTSLAFHSLSTIHIQHHRDSIISSARYRARYRHAISQLAALRFFCGRAWHPPESLPSTSVHPQSSPNFSQTVAMSNLYINGTSERALPNKRNPLLTPEKTQPRTVPPTITQAASDANPPPNRQRAHRQAQARTDEPSCKTWASRDFKCYKA